MISRTQRTLEDDDISKVASTYHAWRRDAESLGEDPEYSDTKGFCKSADLDEVAEHNCVLTPGRYVGIAETDEDDDESLDQKTARRTRY